MAFVRSLWRPCVSSRLRTLLHHGIPRTTDILRTASFAFASTSASQTRGDWQPQSDLATKGDNNLWEAEDDGGDEAIDFKQDANVQAAWNLGLLNLENGAMVNGDEIAQFFILGVDSGFIDRRENEAGDRIPKLLYSALLQSLDNGSISVEHTLTLMNRALRSRTLSLRLFKAISQSLAASGHELQTLKPELLSRSVWTLARSGYPSSALTSSLLEAVLAGLKAGKFKMRQLAEIGWSIVRMQQFHDELFRQWSSEVIRCMDDPHTRSVDIMKCWYTVARVQKPNRNPALTAALGQATLQRAKGLSARELATILWSASKVAYFDEMFWVQLLSAAVDRVHEFEPQGLATLLELTAQKGIHVDAVVSPLWRQCEGFLSSNALNARSLTSLLNAAAKFNVDGDRLLQLQKAIQGRMKQEQFPSRSVVAILSLLSRFPTKKRSPALATKLSEAVGVAAEKGQLNDIDYAMVFLALSKLGFKEGKSIDAVVNGMLTALHQRKFAPATLTNVFSGAHSLGILRGDTFARLNQGILDFIRKGACAPQALASIAFVYAASEQCSPSDFQVLWKEVIRKLQRRMFSPRSLATCVWAASLSGTGTPSLYRALTASILREAPRGHFTAQDCRSIVVGLTKAGHADSAVLGAMSGKITALASTNALDAVGILHALNCFVSAKTSNATMYHQLLQSLNTQLRRGDVKLSPAYMEDLCNSLHQLPELLPQMKAEVKETLTLVEQA